MYRMNSFLVCFCVYFSLACIESQSNNGLWFDGGKYISHCDPPTSSDNGICTSGKCARGWFGFKCQYQDTATLDTSTVVGHEYLTDRDENTCSPININGNISVSWTKAYIFSWLRLKLSSKSSINSISLQFYASNHELNCNNRQDYQLKNGFLDIKCEVELPITKIVVHTNVSICSLYINGGRNIALRQQGRQSSTYIEKGLYCTADRATDGNRNSSFDDNSCTHTDINDTHPYFYIAFPLSNVYRIKLYNRDVFPLRLSYFHLELQNKKSVVYQQDGTGSNLDVYSIFPGHAIYADTMNISTIFQLSGDPSPILTLCEVEIYGDCIPSKWGLYCQDCSSLCANKNCHIETGECLEGCLSGHYGQKCEFICQLNCQGPCYRDTGFCLSCLPGYQGPYCTECQTDLWGGDCSNKCSELCYNKTCDRSNGSCILGCIEGYYGINCTKQCDEFHYGRNCNETCSINCANSTCSPYKGKCYLCSLGHQGVFCEQDLLLRSLTNEQNNNGKIFATGFGAGIAVMLVLVGVTFGIIYFRHRRHLHQNRNEISMHQMYDDTNLDSMDKHHYEEIVDVPAKNEKPHPTVL